MSVGGLSAVTISQMHPGERGFSYCGKLVGNYRPKAMISIRRTRGCHVSCLWKRDNLDYIDTCPNYGGSIYQVMCNASEVYLIEYTITNKRKRSTNSQPILNTQGSGAHEGIMLNDELKEI